jgi:hypothetical protein
MRLIKTGTNTSSEHPHPVLIEPKFFFMLVKSAKDTGVTPADTLHQMIEQVLASPAQTLRFEDYINNSGCETPQAATAQVVYTSEVTSALLCYLSYKSGLEVKVDQTAQLLIAFYEADQASMLSTSAVQEGSPNECGISSLARKHER